MAMNLVKRKRIQAAIVILTAAFLVIAGTFAWNNFTQQRINVFRATVVPNVNLHDDFAGGPEKDVYVENSGNGAVLVRVRLVELLKMNMDTLPEGAQDDEALTNWHWHTPEKGSVTACDFKAHEYFTWAMDGHKFYMPASESAHGLQTDETFIEPIDVGDLDEIIDYAALLRDAFSDNETVLGYIDEYLNGDNTHAADLQDAITALPNGYYIENVRQYDGQETELTRELNEVHLTLIPGQIVTMTEWMQSKQPGDFWVMDDDGWCYWANALLPSTATGQLLSSVTYKNNYPGGELLYRINVRLNATTFSGNELGAFFTAAGANGGISEDGMLLMLMSSGDFRMGEDGELYKDEGGGAYRKVERATGGFMEYSLSAIIYAGTDGQIGTADDTNVSPEDMERRYFHHIGNGVYVEVADETGTEAIDAPDTTYYFSSTIFGDEPYEINNAGGQSTDAQVAAIFSFTLQINEKFGVWNDEGDGSCMILKGDDMQAALELTGVNGGIDTIFTMLPLYHDDNDGNFYIDLSQNTGAYENLYIGASENGSGTFGGQYSGGLASINEDTGMMVFNPQVSAPGTGSKEDPYKIRSRFQMDWVTREVMNGNSFKGEYLEVDKDFSMGSTDFLPIGNDEKPFLGTFDGGGFTISDLKISSSANYIGLFGCIGEFGAVFDLKLENTDVTGYGFTGGLAGRSYGTVENCYVSGKIYGAADNAGGIIGMNHGGITSCHFSGDLIGDANNDGGIAGYNTGIVQGCTVSGTVTGTASNQASGAGGCVGGIVGMNHAVVTDCENNAKVVGKSSSDGGIVGYNTGVAAVIRCVNKGDVEGVGNVGGIVGFSVTADSKIIGSSNSGKVTGTGNNVGGVVGGNEGTVTGCGNSGDVTGGTDTGGVVGSNGGTLTKSYSHANISSGATGAGGVVGGNYGSIKYCYAWGNVTSIQNGAGGVAGRTGQTGVSTISDVYHANGTITCGANTNWFSGGISGYNQGDVTNAYALATSVAGRRGTVAGYGSTVTNSYYAFSNTTGFSYVTGIYKAKPANLSGWTQVSADFNNSAIWTWDDANKLPVLIGVTPNFSGDGTAESPYLIDSVVDLGTLSAAVMSGDSFENKHFKLESSLNLGGASFSAIGNETTHFKGLFDGNDKSISNLTIVSSNGNANFNALFGYNDGTVKNLTLEKATIAGYQHSGGIAAVNNGTIEGCTVRDTAIDGVNPWSGGIAGVNNEGASIIACKVTGTGKVFTSNVNYGGQKGGIAGNNKGTITNCTNDVPVSGVGNLGGIAGVNTGTVTGCTNNGTISKTNAGAAPYIGGLVGNNTGTVSGCTNNGTKPDFGAS